MLPSVYTGGALTVTHDGTEFGQEEFDPDATPFSYHFFAYYNSLKCNMTPLTSGRCLWLLYDLHCESAPVPPERMPIAEKIAEFMQQWEKRAGPSKIVYVLETCAPLEQLDWRRLSCEEEDMVLALQVAAKIHPFQMYLHGLTHYKSLSRGDSDDRLGDVTLSSECLPASSNVAKGLNESTDVLPRELIPSDYWQLHPPDIYKERKYKEWNDRFAIVFTRLTAAQSAQRLIDLNTEDSKVAALEVLSDVMRRGPLTNGELAARVIPVVQKLDATGDRFRSFVHACLCAEWGAKKACCALTAAFQSMKWRGCGTLVANAFAQGVHTRGRINRATWGDDFAPRSGQQETLTHCGLICILHAFALYAPAAEVETVVTGCADLVRKNAKALGEAYRYGPARRPAVTHTVASDMVTALARRVAASEVRVQTALTVLAALASMLVTTAALSESLAAACALIGWPACVSTLASCNLGTLIARDRNVRQPPVDEVIRPDFKSVAPLLRAAAAALDRPNAPTSDIIGLLRLLSKFPDVAEAPPLEPLLQRLCHDDQTAFATESIRNFAVRPELAIVLLPRLAAVAPHTASAMVAELFRSPLLFRNDNGAGHGALPALYALLVQEEAKVSPAPPLPALIGENLLKCLLAEVDRNALMLLPEASPTARGVLQTLQERLTQRISAISQPRALPQEVNLPPCCELCDAAVTFLRAPGDVYPFMRDDCHRGQPRHTEERLMQAKRSTLDGKVTATKTSLRIAPKTDRQALEEDLEFVQGVLRRHV